MNYQKSQQSELTLEQKENVAFFFASLAATTVIVFLRRKVGLRIVSAWSGLVMVGLICIAPPFKEGAFSPAKAWEEPFPYQTGLPPDRPVRPGWLGLFATASLLAAGRQHAARKRDMRNGIPWHTYHLGIPILSFGPGSESIVARFIDPTICILAGLGAWHWFSIALGAWLIFAGMALWFVEQRVHKEALQRELDAVDAGIESGTLSEVVQRFEQHPSAKTYRTGDAEVIHATLSEDVEALIAKRKKRNKK